MDTFTVLLSSNASADVFPNNTIGNYRNQLQSYVNFEKDETWKVGLLEVTYPKTWLNVPRDLEIGYEINGNITLHQSLFLPAGHYATDQILIDKLNERIQKFKPAEDATMPELWLDPITHRVRFKRGFTTSPESGLPEPIYAYLIPELRALLGVEIPDGSKTHEPYFWGTQAVGLRSICSNFYLYSDICGFSFVADTMSQLLRSVPVDDEKPYGQQIRIRFDTPLFTNVTKKSFDSIEIDLKSDSNTTIEFNSGRVTVLLLFKRVNNEQ
jgi:hypothetical protein